MLILIISVVVLPLVISVVDLPFGGGIKELIIIIL